MTPQSDTQEAAAVRSLIRDIRACTVCAGELPHAPRPVVRLHPDARILIVGQAPGVRVHAVGAPFVDASGDRLRNWMGLDEPAFYDPTKVAVAPMGFCFPGQSDKGADLPPLKACAPLWQARVRQVLPRLRLIALVGGYAVAHHLGRRDANGQALTLSAAVHRWRDAPDPYFPLPHPSWRNTQWIKTHPWFASDVLPAFKARVASALS